MLKIGDFSTLTMVSIKALRHYDELGLLKPVWVDPVTGYRYYSATQLPRLQRILALRDLGFPLERIGKILDDGVTAEQLRGMMMLRQSEQEVCVQREQEKLARLQARIQLMEQEGVMTQDVVVKELGSQWIASIRERVRAYREIGILFGKLYGKLGLLAAEGPAVALWHDQEFKDSDLDAEVGVCIKRPVPTPEGLQVRDLAACSVASTIHRGAFNRIGEAYGGLLRWIEANGYRIAGPTREIFIHITPPVTRENESYVTEIQVPVAKGLDSTNVTK